MLHRRQGKYFTKSHASDDEFFYFDAKENLGPRHRKFPILEHIVAGNKETGPRNIQTVACMGFNMEKKKK